MSFHLHVFVGVYVYVQTTITNGEFKNSTAETAGSEKSTWPVLFYAHSGLRGACAELVRMFDPVLATCRRSYLKAYIVKHTQSLKPSRLHKFHSTKPKLAEIQVTNK